MENPFIKTQKSIACILTVALIFNGGVVLASTQPATVTTDVLGNPIRVVPVEEETDREDEVRHDFIGLPLPPEPLLDFLDGLPLSRVDDAPDEPEVAPESNDPFSDSSGTWGQSYEDMWWFGRVRAEEAWAYTRGEGVTIAVIDSGLDTSHPDIADNVFQNLVELNGTAGFDDDGNGFIDDITGWDFVVNDNDPNDFNGHGTHVAGILGAVADNALGIAGIAPKAKVLPVRVLNSSGSGYLSNLNKAIRYAADLGAQVINMSLGLLRSSATAAEIQLMADAVQYASDRGTIVVAAAGNSAVPVSNYLPSGLANVIAVGATNPVTDTLASFSNYGADLDLVAPGVDILSLKSGETTCTLCSQYPSLIVQNNYMRLTGTSMAAPIVSGAVALMMAADPLLTLDDIRRRLLYSSEDLGLPGKDNTYGAGMLDIFTAISTDYYGTGEIKTRWLAEADAEGVVQFDFDLLGRVARKLFEDGAYADLTYWSGTADRFEQIFYDAAGVWQKTEEYYADGVTLHFVYFADGTVLEYDENGNLITDEGLDFNDFTLANLPNQSLNANQFEVLDGGQTLRMYGNNWKGIRLNQTITADTVLEFDFKSTGAIGEINSIGFAPNLQVESGRAQTFQLYGTQNWGAHQDYSYTNVGGWQHFVIPVGAFYTGFFQYLIFADDADAGQATDVQYRNIVIKDTNVGAPTIDTTDSFTNQVNLTLTGTKAADTSLWLNGLEVVALNSATTWSVPVTLPSEALHSFSFTSKDGDGNESAAAVVDITLDTTDPTGYVQIDNDAAVTTDLNVNLTLTQVDVNPGKMRIFVEGADVTGWINYETSYSATLPSGAGLKEVRAEFQDKAGNISTVLIADTITLEEDLSGFINFDNFTLENLPNQSVDANNVEVFNGGKLLGLYGNNWKGIRLGQTITADTVLEFDFKSTGAQGEINSIGFAPNLQVESGRAQTFQIYGTQNWGKYQNYSYTNAGGWQHFVIPVGTFFTGFFEYLIFADDADAGQNTDVIYGNILIQDTAVAAPVIDQVDSVTNEANPTLTGTKAADTALWLNGVEVVALDSATTWSVPVSLPSESLHSFSFTSKDADGNESSASVIELTLDTTVPAGSVVIDGGAAVTTDLNVSLTLSQVDANPDKMRVFVEGADVTGWINYQASYTATLPSGDGLKEVRVEFKDKAGNVSTDFIADTITLEEQPVDFLNFNDFTLSNLPNQSLNANQFEVLDGGQTLRMYGNNWKGIRVDQTITADTVLEFDFKSTGAQGEINSIGFAPNLQVESGKAQTFQLYGTQNWGAYQNYSYTTLGDWQHFVIPIGAFYTGFFQYLIFADDADTGQATDVQYRNISIG
ncbi:MAG: S8 family serine peptidase [Candidatus Omnitrophota bacterium]|nr:S8 family serine peptidase [Candidatus Omnitrophota bacterium]